MLTEQTCVFRVWTKVLKMPRKFEKKRLFAAIALVTLYSLAEKNPKVVPWRGKKFESSKKGL